MAVQNSLTKTQAQQNLASKEVTYEVDGSVVSLTLGTIKNYLISGNKDAVTQQELVMFLNLCKFNRLNPWLKEAYCIKYGSEAATMVVGISALQKRAEEHPSYDGSEAGIIVYNGAGEINYRKGAFRLPDEKIIGGYAEVWRKDRAHSTRAEVSFDEYVGKKKDGTHNAQWASKPATMIRKVALAQALREAFPKTLGGMFTAEEQGVAEPDTTPAANIIDMEMPQSEQPAFEAEIVEPTATPTDSNDVAATFFN